MSKAYGIVMAAFAAICVAAPARANTQQIMEYVRAFQNASVIQAQLTALDWRVNDKTSVTVKNVLLNGSIDAFVREDTGAGYWLQQDANLGMMGKQKIEILLNKTTGQVEKILVNGQEQKAPSASNVEVVEMKEDKVTVPAGTFDCIYAKIRNKDDGKISQAWINPKAVPMMGQLKAVAESQLGEITQELVSFQFAPR